MKKQLIIVLAGLLTLASAAAAQNSFAGFGVKGGINFAAAAGQTIDMFDFPDTIAASNDGTKRAIFGAYAAYRFTKNIELQLEAYYEQMGFTTNWVNVNHKGRHELAYKLDYFEIPLLFRWVIYPDKAAMPTVFVGPTMSLMLSNTVHRNFENQPQVDLKIKNITDTNYGMTFGGELGWPLPWGRIVFDARYSFDFTNLVIVPAAGDSSDEEWLVLKDGQGVSPEKYSDPRAKNNAFSLMIGYEFNLRKPGEDEFDW